MISESWYWKQPLLETAQRLTLLKSVIDVSEEQLVQFEKDILIGFCSIRKLFETQTKVTDAIKATKLDLSWHPNKGKKVTWRNNHKLDELYDFERGGRETRDVWFICGRLVHSFILAPLFSEAGGLEAILFTSDTDKDKRLYSLHIDRAIELFALVGGNYPTHIEWQRDPDTDEESTVVK
jgi:hypothetical protein